LHAIHSESEIFDGKKYDAEFLYIVEPIAACPSPDKQASMQCLGSEPNLNSQASSPINEG